MCGAQTKGRGWGVMCSRGTLTKVEVGGGEMCGARSVCVNTCGRRSTRLVLDFPEVDST